MSHHHHRDKELEEAQQRMEQSRKQTEMGNKFRLPEGKSLIRLLYTPGDKERHSPAIYREYQVHRNVGPGKRMATCGNEPGETGNCWLCKKQARLEKEGKTKRAAALAPQLQLAVQAAVFDRDTNDWVGPLLWDMPSGKTADSLGYKIRGVISNKRRRYLDHKAGYNFEIKRRGTGLKTRYGDVDPDDEKTAVPKGILKRLKPFADLGMYSYDEQWQKDAYYGREKEKENDDMAAKKRGRRAKDEEVSSSEASSSEASSSEASSSSSEASSSSSEASSSSSEASSSEASSSEASGSESSSSESSSSEASSSEASGSESSSSSSEAEKPKKGKKGKKGKKDSSESSEASSSEASSSEASSSEASSSSSEASGSESSSSASEAEKKPKRRTRKARKPRAKKGKKARR